MIKQLYYLTFSKDADWAKKEGINDDLLLASLKSLRRHSNAQIVVLMPRGTEPLSDEAHRDCIEMGVRFWNIKPKKWHGRRMLCRLEHLTILMKEFAFTEIISSEADEFFFSDPFALFDDFDIGIGSRCLGAKIPVNAGLVLLRNTQEVRSFYDWAIDRVTTDSGWDTYSERKHKKNTADVYCDRDMWWATWDDSERIGLHFDIDIALVDAGYHMSERKCSFHLKGHSKKQIYTEEFRKAMR